MAKRARARRKSGGGLLDLLGQSLMLFGRAFNGSADWVAEHIGNPKPARRASLEWTQKGKGEHLPATPIALRWHAKHTGLDKEIWKATFVSAGAFLFETWPPRDYAEAARLAQEAMVERYGVYAESWELSLVERVGKVVPDVAESIEA